MKLNQEKPAVVVPISCFTCDSMRYLCGGCGESIVACQCGDDGERIPCPDCQMPDPESFPSISAIAKAIGMKPRYWRGRCHHVAYDIIASGLIEGEDRYGLYHGPIDPKGFFGKRPFSRHGWIEMPDGNICDPTRWVFTNDVPHLYVCGPNPEYDFGGNAMRAATDQGPPAHNPRAEQFKLELSAATREEINSRFKGKGGEYYTKDQIRWLANIDPDSVRNPGEVYRAIVRAGMEAYIPMDNARRYLKQGDFKRSDPPDRGDGAPKPGKRGKRAVPARQSGLKVTRCQKKGRNR